MDIQLLDERNGNKPLAVLIDVEPGVYLNEIRQIISDQVSDILPEGKYEFQHHGIKISKAEEATVRLSKIALSGDDPSLCMLSLSFSNLNGAENVSKDMDLESPLSVMSQSIPWVPISPPGRLSGICHFGEKMLQMPHHGVQIMQQNPHPWGLTLTQMPHPWGQNISFLRIFEPKTRMHALSRINITVFKIDSVAISFQNVLIKILKSQNLI